MNPITLTTQDYTFIGTLDGRVYQYTKDTMQLISRLFSFKFRHADKKNLIKKNAVRAIAHFEDFVAASGYGGEIIIMNTITQVKKKHLLKSKATVTALMFLSKYKLISANVDGEIHIYNLQNKSVKKLVTTLHEIKQIIYLKESHSLLVRGATNYISLVNLSSEKVEQNKFHSFKDIVALLELKSHNTLLVTLKNSQKKQIKLSLPSITQEEKQFNPILSVKGSKQLLKAYEENNFRLCYETIDEYKLYSHELALLLEGHWKKLMRNCEEFALNGEAKGILTTLQELLFIQTRTQKIGDLLRLSFYTKITQLQTEKLYQSTENIIYSYIDIFGFDQEIAELIKNYELVSRKKIAIFNNASDRKSRSFWWHYFHEGN